MDPKRASGDHTARASPAPAELAGQHCARLTAARQSPVTAQVCAGASLAGWRTQRGSLPLVAPVQVVNGLVCTNALREPTTRKRHCSAGVNYP